MNRNTNLKSKMNGSRKGELGGGGGGRRREGGKTWAIFMNRVQRELKAALFGRKANPMRVGRQRGIMGMVLFPYSWQDRWWSVRHMLSLTLRWTERVGPPVGMVTASCSVHTLNNNDVRLSE